MKYERTHDRLIYEQAARWHLLLQQNPSDERKADFDRWLTESRRHVRNYLLVVALDRELGRIDLSDVALEGLPASATNTVVAMPRPTSNEMPARSTPPRPRKFRPLTAAAAVLALIAGALALQPWQWLGRYSTQIGEQRIVKLDDGSVMYLNTQSRAQVKYSASARTIHLLSGEASFVAARDPSRPFKVETDGATIQAIGTEFNVYRRGSQTAVAVVEGRVQVLTDSAPLPLNAGEAADVAKDGHAIKRARSDVNTTVAWRNRRLVFREDSLAHIAEEFNRYNEAPRVRIEGAEAQARRYSGIFDAYDPNSLAQVLSADGDLEVESSAVEIRVRRHEGR